ncbi:UDP-2,3-diacylglucosamine diphosphatase [Weeksella virosa]|uniref:Metallophosphoesterase n=1 Tax=Weeksella virosa (strain ATCC 43766 / DSM 16922 / JCM 21250 / CCUG 30538 / CDC 9751 / IAM 14551 / NBRC 16016 / NCTC 11634 / CL345/78) TaxID=865938 RepID=F0NZ04_WEEVC|nr:UDP-2,3-diacylglucosamine diphosphatase [Weeksella virosa]ADX68221.1 metallophosphoesterase [Weeksella virosa DSM 16922]MDK7674824.1 UDP-2,3-diacylglucosamine diphosphatase [Weeksella virosa]SUP54534.1 UDP-2,3-diacylglucosamine hydrolase [Weeksella virosa]VEH64142.1 UDP-2,3-diacylglucosamine hydrolase [Weeksella virosa]
MKRKVDLVIISDVHLGTYGCKAKELLAYLKSIKPKKIILNGDFIDIWQFKKSYFPATHLEIIKHILNLSLKGTEVIYITGNHDEFLRKFPKVQFGNIQIVDKLVLTVDYKKVWIFHGDVFDLSVQHSKWIAKLGGIGYDYLIRINNLSNWVLKQFGYEKYSFSKKIKNSVKKAVKYINDFEQTAAELAIENNYDYVICGHIHQPQIKKVTTNKGECVYLNSGDWIENLTTIEFHKGLWKIHHYETGQFEYENQEDWLKNELLEQDEQMFENLMESIQIKIK